MKVTTISDFRANLKEYMNTVVDTGNPVVINRGRNAAVLISLDEYNSIMATKAAASSKFVSKYREAHKSLNSDLTVKVDLSEL